MKLPLEKIIRYESEDGIHVKAMDMGELVRCKDCKWGVEKCGNIECFVDLNVPTEYHGYEWFCHLGERKDDEQV